MKRVLLAGFLILSLFSQNFVAFAANPLSVVISEIAWAGSATSSSDEWIELYNNSSNDMNLAGWKIIDDGTSEYLITSGIIKAHDYFIIASNLNAAGVPADFVKTLSLANSGDSLVLKDDSGAVVDEANPTGGAWPAGDATNKLTMERVDFSTSGALSSNWKSSISSAGSPKVGTNTSGPPSSGETKINLETSATQLQIGSEFEVFGKIEDAENLFAYGLDLNFDPQILEFLDASEGDFFAQSSYDTAFEWGLENNQQGHLILADSLLNDSSENMAGLNGDGTLFTLTFKVISDENTALTFDDQNFAANIEDEMPLTVSNLSITVSNGETGVEGDFIVKNLTAGLGASRYALVLNWTTPTNGADAYKVLKLDQNGQYQLLAETTENTFTDSENLVPQNLYEYKVIPVLNDIDKPEAVVSATETRGLKGDNDRSDRVDGRDLYNLALIFGANMNDESYSALVDTSYDGLIDGEDLLDLAGNWAVTY